METDTVLKKEDITDMVSQIEAVKEEAKYRSDGKNQNLLRTKIVFAVTWLRRT